MSNICLVTGSAGLIGSEAVRYFSKSFDKVVGIDNDMRASFFGENASTQKNRDKLIEEIPNYIHHNDDLRKSCDAILSIYGKDIKLIIHTAAQPAHDFPAKSSENVFLDFNVNAVMTLHLLEAARTHCPDTVFIFTSTNKVYGDTPNRLPLIEKEKRFEINNYHKYYNGIDETMSIDQTKHSLFGASKVAADVLVQEYGKYFGMKTAAFRGGCLTGGHHSGTELHGFLAYLGKCVKYEKDYKIFGYQGHQVRDNIHSYDVITAFEEFYKAPKCGEVYNIGGNRFSNCSMQEAIEAFELLTEKKAKINYINDNRNGDHIWYISSMEKFKKDYPGWNQKYTIEMIYQEIVEKA